MNKADKNQLTPLTSFCDRFRISRNQLSEIAGGDKNDASKSTMQRLLHDQITDADYRLQLRKALAENLPSFLLDRGLSISEINRELLTIFDKGEYQPMITEKTILPKNVQTFFNLSDDPFNRAPKSRAEVFLSAAIKDVVDRAIDLIRYQGFGYVSGPIGSGKTVVRALIEDQVSQNSNLHLIFPETFDMQRVSPANISRAILETFDEAHIPNDAVSRAKKVKNVLSKRYQSGDRVAIAFDECHRLNDTTVSSLKNFLEMNSGGFQKYLGVILFGQPQFENRLYNERFQEIVERITPIKMPSFKDSSAQYLAHRLALVGGNLQDLFDDAAIDLIVRQAETPLAVGNIANRALVISKEDFNNKKVIGAAISTKMFFASKDEPAYKKKAAR